jgi:alpha-galactosidase
MAVSPFLFLVLLVLLPPPGARWPAVAAAARAPLRIAPLPTAALRRIYDTSNYGRLQLNNGLALAPQMG